MLQLSAAALSAILVVAAAHGRPPPPPVDPALAKLIAKYEAKKNASCAVPLGAQPTLGSADVEGFMHAFESWHGNGSEAGVIAAAAKLTSSPALQAFLSLPDSVGTANGIDASLVRCTVLVQAERGTENNAKAPGKPNAIAEFALLGAAEELLVDTLLGNPELMLDFLVAGGVAGGMYGQAMQIWTDITASSAGLRAVLASPKAVGAAWDDRDPGTILKRLAVGTAVALADPVAARGANGTSPCAGPSCLVDPVSRYAHFEKYYALGQLDPAFSILTSFELAHTMDEPALESDTLWLRDSMPKVRPDFVGMEYHWRYAESVHEVQYGDSQCAKLPGVCNGGYSDIPVGGDVCGGRAFWTRFSRRGYGIPTWGATEPGHAAMSSWTPAGWNVMLGAPWPDCWWGNRGGLDFVLETQARVNLPAYQQILRGLWLGYARDDVPISRRWGTGAYNANNGVGGLYPALMLYLSKSVAASSPPMNVTLPPAPNNRISAIVERFAQPLPPAPPVTVASDGTITIPAVSFASQNKSAPISVIHSQLEGAQMVNNGCTSPVGPPCFDQESSSWTYDVTAAAAGTYFLTANFSTYHMNQDLFVSVNDAKAVEVGMFYTVADWNETQPVEVTLTKGSNTLTFTRTSGRDVSFKTFTLYKNKPVVPPAPKAYHPIPAPPTPGAGAYIEVPAATTCVKQGIHPVNEADCGHACLALGFKSTGPRARANMSGCFVMTTGPYAGNCNFNTNTSATCTPPCQLYGSVTRALCLRG